MTTASIDLHTDAARQPWSALLWIAPLTAFWIVLNYELPVIAASGMPTVFSRVFIHVLIALALWLALERTELTPVQRRNTWLAVMLPYTLWLAVAWGAAINGAFSPGVSRVPLLPLSILVPVIVGVPILLRSRRIGLVLDAIPATWLVALQVYRVLGSTFLIGWARGVMPAVFSLPAGTGDVLTGLLAVPIAIHLASGSDDGRRAAIAWNVFGLIDFTVAIGIAFLIALQIIVPSIPNTANSVYPTVLTPAFAVPSSILLHVLSLRQLRRRARQAERAGAPFAAPALA
ncbi:MAG TPA: hypothetical protein VHU15_08635 [Stellaceae bacterium]|nr:hypothetical protein [Stellaceae bacterium]